MSPKVIETIEKYLTVKPTGINTKCADITK